MKLRVLSTFCLAFVALGATCESSKPVASSAAPIPSAAHAKKAPSAVPTDDIQIPPDAVPAPGTKLELSDEQWRERLTKRQYEILRQKGTEYPGSGAYNKHYEDGTYHCSACNAPLFSSAHKFDSKTGWPSFFAAAEGRVGEIEDRTHGMTRTEIVCDHCGGHLGHVFDDGPEPTGLRYCVNSVSLYFRPATGESE